MKVKILCFVSLLFLAGCAARQMPSEHYRLASDFDAYAQKCFEANLMSPKLYADAREAIHGLVASWSYDSTKLNNMRESAYSNATATEQDCRNVEVAAHTYISEYQKMSYQQESAASGSSTVQCKKLLDFSGKVYTFTGGICPIGYFKF